jgi:integrase
MIPALARLLATHQRRARARGWAGRDDFVFTNSLGGPCHRENLRSRVLKPTADRAGLNTPTRRITFHDFRRTYASHLIRTGIDPVRAATQLGHADPGITLRTYARDFATVTAHSEISEKLDVAFGGIVSREAPGT